MDSILSNNSTDDHCREFVRLGGLDPLINILGLPNLPLDFVTSPACQSVSGVCKSILVGIDFLSFFVTKGVIKWDIIWHQGLPRLSFFYGIRWYSVAISNWKRQPGKSNFCLIKEANVYQNCDISNSYFFHWKVKINFAKWDNYSIEPTGIWIEIDLWPKFTSISKTYL